MMRVLRSYLLVGRLVAGQYAIGTVSDRVVVKHTPTSPEAPVPFARVALITADDCRRAWSGYADAMGNYRATGLQVGRAYVPVAIDKTGTHQAVAAGPVVAVPQE